MFWSWLTSLLVSGSYFLMVLCALHGLFMSYVHIYVWYRMHTCMCRWYIVHIHYSTHPHKDIHKPECEYIYTHMLGKMLVYKLNRKACTCTHTHTHAHTHTHTHTCTYTLTHTHADTHSFTHSHSYSLNICLSRLIILIGKNNSINVILIDSGIIFSMMWGKVLNSTHVSLCMLIGSSWNI